MSTNPFQLLAFSGERVRSDGRLHADVSVKFDHPAATPRMMRELREKLLATGHSFKFGQHTYQIEQCESGQDDTLRLYLSRESDATKRAQEAALWASMEKIFVGGQS